MTRRAKVLIVGSVIFLICWAVFLSTIPGLGQRAEASPITVNKIVVEEVEGLSNVRLMIYYSGMQAKMICPVVVSYGTKSATQPIICTAVVNP